MCRWLHPQLHRKTSLSAHTHPPSTDQIVPRHVPLGNVEYTERPPAMVCHSPRLIEPIPLVQVSRCCMAGPKTLSLEMFCLWRCCSFCFWYTIFLPAPVLPETITDWECPCSAMDQSRGSCTVLEALPAAQQVTHGPCPTWGSTKCRGQCVFHRQLPATGPGMHTDAVEAAL